jgi:hypothetical protein
MKIGGNRSSWRSRLALMLLAFGATSSLQAAGLDVGTWSGSAGDKRWGQPSFQNIFSTLNLVSGATYNQNAGVSNINNFTHFVIAEATQTMSAPDINALRAWIQNGGILLLFVDTSLVNPGQGVNNLFYSQNILAGLGSSIQIDLSGNTFCPAAGGGACTAGVNASLATGLTSSTPGAFAVNGGAGLGGQSLATPWGSIRVSGGNSIAAAGSSLADLIRTEQFGLGTIFVFGDRFDSNWVLGGSGGVGGCNLVIPACAMNQQLFSNIFLANGGGGPISEGPEPGSLLLMTGGLATLVVLARRRRTH